MKLVCEIDFSPLTPEEKVEFVHDLRDSMAQSFQEQPPSVQMLAHALIFTRWWNSYKHIAPEEPTPEILVTAIELLWDFLEELGLARQLEERTAPLRTPQGFAPPESLPGPLPLPDGHVVVVQQPFRRGWLALPRPVGQLMDRLGQSA